MLMASNLLRETLLAYKVTGWRVKRERNENGTGAGRVRGGSQENSEEIKVGKGNVTQPTTEFWLGGKQKINIAFLQENIGSYAELDPTMLGQRKTCCAHLIHPRR